MSTAYILLGHGSQADGTFETLCHITDIAKKRIRSDNLICAALQFNKPSLEEAIDIFAGKDVKEIVILPFFLTSGNHIQQDIPEIIEEQSKKYPSIKIGILDHIGTDYRLIDIIVDKINLHIDENKSDNDFSQNHLSPETTSPQDIEKRSFQIIEEAINLDGYSANEKQVVMRMIHAAGDLSLVEAIEISRDAVNSGIEALLESKPIIVDVNMAAVGINKKLSEEFCNQIICKVDSKEVIEEAKISGQTRSATAFKMLSSYIDGAVVVVGNAPTALFELLKIAKEQNIKPALVIGTPVGFVGAAESKEALRKSKLEYITVRGTRGGSSIATAAINALLNLANKELEATVGY